ncbi:beta-lactamase family protein [Flavobacteriaceae bacterium TP-CH-4]|uniref:Beta-lactamase family protein n=1 Tax=Pelagihabitans pacificus TaxID=2696054 RepID=A0A967ARX3_9FLAO|nr:serine hydrolase domain-containing protein [Pelagihabitans pacificus]NHF59168.1 beta-lactamase family protein [Pelagihabitans pacificus]
MKKISVCLSIVALLLISCSETKKETNQDNGLSTFKKEMTDLKAYFQIPGMAVIVKKDDEIIYEDYLGYSDIEAQIKVDSTTLFPIASLTKVFSGITMMSLVEEGKLSLNSPANEFFENDPFEKTIQVKHILSHTSQGIPPGENFYYSSRFGALTNIIEKALGDTFEAGMQRKVLSPLKLQHTFFLKDSNSLNTRKAPFAKPYILDDGIQEGFVDFGFSTAAGLVSTARDLTKVDNALDNNRLIPESSKIQMFSAFKNGLPYGYGIFTESFEGKKIVWAYGQYDCYSSLWLKVPSEDITLIVMANNNLMSDPARLIYGNGTSSLFVLSLLKNLVFEQEEMPLFEESNSGITLKSALYREKLKAQALAASFMARYDVNEFKVSKKLLNHLFTKYPDYLKYADLALLHNLSFLKEVAFHRGLGEFNDFDTQLVAIGEKLLQQDANNPYANYYLGSFYDKAGEPEKATIYFQRIVGAKNFSENWYTVEAQQGLNNQSKNQD